MGSVIRGDCDISPPLAQWWLDVDFFGHVYWMEGGINILVGAFIFGWLSHSSLFTGAKGFILYR